MSNLEKIRKLVEDLTMRDEISIGKSTTFRYPRRIV